MRYERAMAGAALAVALALTGCGKASEKIAEKTISESVGGDVDISEGRVKVQTPEGEISYEVDEDGNVRYSGPDGEVAWETDGDGNVQVRTEDGESVYSTGDNASLPEGWPDTLALPEGAELLSSNRMTTDGTTTLSVVAEVDGAPRELYDGYKEALEDDGYEVDSETYTEGGNGDIGRLTATKGEVQVSVGVLGESGKTSLNLMVIGA